MGQFRQHVLIVGGKGAGLKSIAPMLRRAEFSVHSVDPSPFLLDLVLSTAFELVIVRYPIDGVPLDDLVDTIRSEGSACHGAGLLLLAEPDLIDDAELQVNLGANRAICTTWSEDRLWKSIGDLLDIAPRIFLQVLMHAEIKVQNTEDRVIFQTVNMSVSGALLQGFDQLDEEQAFDFLFRLPGGGLVEGSAEIVRQTNPLHEGVHGMGARFTSLGDGCEDRLLAHILRQVDLGNNR